MEQAPRSDKMDIRIYLRYKVAMLKIWQAPKPRNMIHKTIANALRTFAYMLLLFAGYTYQHGYYLMLITSIASSIFLLGLYDYGLGKHRGWNRQKIREKAILINQKEEVVQDVKNEGQNTDSDNRELAEEQHQ